jgi:hypothetical protein
LSGTDCKPLLVFINRMSGGQQGPGVIQRLSSLLNPNQIIDIRQGMMCVVLCSSPGQRNTQRDLSSPGLWMCRQVVRRWV